MADYDQERYPDRQDRTRTRGRRTKEDPHGLIGQTLDQRYLIENVIGIGGMGVVYKAQQEAMDRTVAVKVLMPQMIDDESLIKRFQLEARAASRLTHPNTITIYDFGQRGDLLYIVMEFLEGRSLEKALKVEGSLSPERTARIASQVCASMHEAHSKGIVHRDIKPDNIWLKVVGDQKDFVKVLDFGVAKLKDPKVSDVTMTQAGMIFGTPKYMSPEQAKAKKLDGRSDLYSLGVVMYQSLVGRCPFTATDPVSILIQHVHDPPPRFKEIRPDLNVPVMLEEMVLKALEKERDHRFADAKEMRQAIDSYLAATISASSQKMPVMVTGTQSASPPATQPSAPPTPSGPAPAPYGTGGPYNQAGPPASAPHPAMTPPPQSGPSPSGPQGGLGVDAGGHSVWNMGADQLNLQGAPATEWVQIKTQQSHTTLLATAIILGLLLLGGIGYLIWRIQIPPAPNGGDEDVIATAPDIVDAGATDEPELLATLTQPDAEQQTVVVADATTGPPPEVDGGIEPIQDAQTILEDASPAVVDVAEELQESIDAVAVALVEDVAHQIPGFANPVRVRFQFDRPSSGVDLDFGDRRFERDETDEAVWIFDLADGEQLAFEASASRYRSGDYDEDISQPSPEGEIVLTVRLRRRRDAETTTRDPCVDPVTGLRDPYCNP